MSDNILIEQAKTDPVAFGKLYERYVDRVYSYIYYRTGNHADSEDLTAKTFHRALNHIRNYQDKGAPFSAWLFRIAHNLIANWHRDQSRRKLVPIENLVLKSKKQELPHEIAEQNETRNQLVSALHQLPAERQQLIALKFAEGMSNAEIAQIMDRSEGAIKSLYHRTLISLRILLNDGKGGKE